MSTTDSMKLLQLVHIHHSSFLKSQVAHAIGMEMYIRSKQINTKEDLASFCLSYISNYLVYNDAIIIKEIFRQLKKKDWEQVVYLAEIYNARKNVLELKKTSRQAGNRFLDRISSIHTSDLIEKWQEEIKDAPALNHYVVVYSLYAFDQGFDLYSTIQTYLYFSLTNLIQHAVRAIPLAPKDAEQVTLAALEKVYQATEIAMSLSFNDMKNNAIGLEISAMQHKYLLSKLFIS
ncbi:urease accessory protein UreF [Gracilibacillus boraciitolerans JCM 21714]|uniref:Urease accessory protein UreF n=1 Tax=Gracilibacillus boraciitolerans JCM 21714 TaxID=1298598 RepID=W4VJ23_9BACI|nr:urease accessory UreF family protein [Gracilibacillus boraciitolerans]GAE93400.1 urease accessory protein UreF [Gracilibacillus boraciitolerans JCM 21714]